MFGPVHVKHESTLTRSRNYKYYRETERNQWPIAGITQLIKSSDEIIRSVELREPSGNSKTRAVNQIFPLEMESEEEAANSGRPEHAHPGPAPAVGRVSNSTQARQATAQPREQHDGAEVAQLSSRLQNAELRGT